MSYELDAAEIGMEYLLDLAEDAVKDWFNKQVDTMKDQMAKEVQSKLAGVLEDMLRNTGLDKVFKDLMGVTDPGKALCNAAVPPLETVVFGLLDEFRE
ncbi:unnamed protein product, partial [Symbiodinium natans]